MSDYIASLLIEPIFRHARRFSPQSPVSGEPVSTAPSNSNLDDDSAQSVSIDCPDTLPHKLDSHESPAVALPTFLDTDLNCTRRRLVACRLSADDALRLGAMDDSEGRHPSGGEDNRIPRSNQATSLDNTEEVPVPATPTIPGDVSISERYDSPHLRELPEDDGMSELRERIHAIRDNDASGNQKARLIHSLMIESYQAARKTFSERQTSSQSLPGVRSREHSPVSPPSSPRIPRSSDGLILDSTERIASTSVRIHYNLSPEDLEPTFAPKETDIPAGNPGETPAADSVPPTEAAADNPINGDYSDEDILVLGCQHYKRNVKLQCYTCKRWYPCRFCHDQTEDHALERRKTENMLCMLCGLPQQAAQWCKGCGEQAASYFCAVCKLWDNDSSKSIYHCHDCGICRIGQGIGKDFYHCKTCSVCIPISIENTHRCIERSTQCDCPICGEYMFTSPDTVVFMRCGHSIHQKCYDEYSKNSYKCPICSKSIMNMEARFRNLDRTIESQPMPSEFEDTRALVYCNDCGAKSDVPYHWLGLKCDLCESYNTAQLRLLSGADDINEGNLVSRSRAVPISIPDHSYDSLSATTLVTESFTEPDARWRPSTATSVDARPIPSQQRAVSPTVGNYFELSRDSTWAASIFSRRRSEGGNEDEDMEPGFWATSPLRKYTFFRKHDGSSDDENESDSGSGTTEEPDDDDDDDDDNVLEEEDEDEIDPIEIFGHR